MCVRPVCFAAGVPESVVSERRKRAEARRRKREKRVAQERELLRQRTAERYAVVVVSVGGTSTCV